MYRREGDSRKVQMQSAEVHFWETSSNLGSKKHKVREIMMFTALRREEF